MRSRFMLLAVALPVLAAAPVHGQTTFSATGGNVVFTPAAFQLNSAFQVYFDALGVHRQIVSDDGISYTLDTKGTVANVGAGSLGSLNLGSFAAGTSMFFTFVTGGSSYTTTAQYNAQPGGGFRLYYVSGTGTLAAGETFVSFLVSNVGSIQNGGCTISDPVVPITCTATLPTVPVTGTPEPGTIALMATGLAGLIPVVRRRRRAASLS